MIMPVTTNHLTTSGNTSAGTAYSSASISPTGNRLVLAAIAHSASGVQPVPTISGGGMTTWNQVNTVEINGFVRISVFRALQSSPSSGALSITFSASQDRCAWSIVELIGIDTGGSNGSNAVVQSATGAVSGSGTSVTATLGDFSNVGNATFGAAVVQSNPERTISPGSGFTEIAEYNAPAGNFIAIQTEFKNTNDTTVDITASGVANHLGIIGLEIAVAATGGVRIPLRGLMGVGL